MFGRFYSSSPKAAPWNPFTRWLLFALFVFGVSLLADFLTGGFSRSWLVVKPSVLGFHSFLESV